MYIEPIQNEPYHDELSHTMNFQDPYTLQNGFMRGSGRGDFRDFGSKS